MCGVVMLGALLGCARPAANSAADGCGPVTYALDREASAERMVGTFRVTLVATSGDSVGRVVAGRLDLRATSREDVALVGEAELPVETVGALRLGDLAGSDEAAPGVVVLHGGTDRPSILLRLGSEANRAGVQRFDGGYTALEVLRMDQSGFSGSWRSGITSNSATGHFCALRTGNPRP